MYTGHGHHIPGTTESTIENRPKNVARCGGPGLCPRCRQEVDEYKIIVGETTDFQERAKLIVKEYVDALHAQNFPGQEPEVFTVYVVWFTKVLQNWKAILGTTLPDSRLFEITYNGDKQVAYVDVYKKQDNFPVYDQPRDNPPQYSIIGVGYNPPTRVAYPRFTE